MKVTTKMREERYRDSTPSQQHLFASEEAGEMLRKIFEDYHVRPELYKAYALAFGDVVLGFEEEPRLPQLLVERVGLPEKLATIIAHDLLEFINGHRVTSGGSKVPAPITPAPQPPEQPSWSKRIEPPQPTPSGATPPVAPQQTTPQYAKPFTDVPRYIPDPYREPPQ